MTASGPFYPLAQYLLPSPCFALRYVISSWLIVGIKLGRDINASALSHIKRRPRRAAWPLPHVDRAVMALLKDAERQAVEILERHRSEIDSLVEALKAHETLDADEIRRCLDPEAKVTVIGPQVAACL